MGKTATNISIVLGLITVAFAGYYIFIQKGSGDLVVETDAETMQNMLNNTQVFVERREKLSQIKMNTALFDDERFMKLNKFTTPIQERPQGRQNPF